MNDYISRQAAIEAIKNDALGLVYYSKKEAIECLNAVPAADVRPVVYGEWVKNEKQDKESISCCSACGYPVSPFWAESNFCPNCGADMRGKRNATP